MTSDEILSIFKQNTPIPLKTASGRIVAEYNPSTKIIQKSVTEAEHMLRIPTAWCFDVTILRQVAIYEREHGNPQMLGVSFEINTKDTKKIYTTTWEIFDGNSFKHNRAGEQLALTIGHWKIVGKDFEQLEMF
tara:strand:+ start:30 stop:428 length:399 start_codon:yes stop_codon:yes gene_type:complete